MSKEIINHDSTIQAIENTRPLSAWGKGVKDAAIDLLGTLEGREITEYNLLNGASNWLHYSEGGCVLIYNSDIWVQVQAKALSQASRLILNNC
tara:strand:- start:713 stop:991 length:279 start_codon:yes stop_codon:yes gene_type:complete